MGVSRGLVARILKLGRSVGKCLATAKPDFGLLIPGFQKIGEIAVEVKWGECGCWTVPYLVLDL